MSKEYGGCLPLEQIIESKNPLLKYSNQTFNSGRSAILGAVRDYKARKLWIPYYLCPTVKEFLLKHGVQVEEYYLTKDYLPLVEEIPRCEMVLWTNWYGCMKEVTIKIVKERYKNQLIIDNAQALFYEPEILNSSCYYVYSCRKFLGVPEGAYLIQKDISKRKEKHRDSTENKWRYLENTMETGSNSQYKYYQENEERMKNDFSDMSNLVKEYLKAISWEKVMKRRKANFDFLHQNLKEKNILDVNFDSDTAFMYPFMVKNEKLRGYLLEKRIFVPRWWRHLLVSENEEKYEYEWSRYIIPIPIDQRYDEKDMSYISKLILDYLEKFDEKV